MEKLSKLHYFKRFCAVVREREREADRQTETDRQRQTDRQTQTETQTDRQTERRLSSN